MTESNFLNMAADIPQKLYIHGVKKKCFWSLTWSRNIKTKTKKKTKSFTLR